MCRARLIAWGFAFALAAGGAALAAEFSDEATALPFPPDTRALKFSASFGDIEYTSGSSLNSLAAFYLKEMASRGWEHDESKAEVDDDSIELVFKHGESEVEVSLSQRSKEVKVSIDTDEVKFTGVDDPAKLAAAGLPVSRSVLFVHKELTLPANVQGLSFDEDGCMFKSTLDLKSAYEHFTKLLAAKGFKESRKPIISAGRQYSEFKKGTTEVSVNVFTDPVGSRVVLEHKDSAKEPVKPPLPAVVALSIGKHQSIDKNAPNAPTTAPNATPVDVTTNKGSATVVYNGKQYTFANVAAYQTKDGPVKLVFSSKPIPLNKMQAMIFKEKSFTFHDMYEGVTPERLEIQLGDFPSFTFALSNLVVGKSVDGKAEDVKVADGRVQGSLKMEQKQVFDKDTISFSFTASAGIITPNTRIAGPADQVETSTLAGDGPVPFPPKTENVGSQGSRFRKTYTATVNMPLAEVAAFYKQALTDKGWERPDANTANLKNDTREVTLTLKAAGNKTTVVASTRETALAKQEGILPEAGKARLLLANAHTAAVVFTIGKTDYPLKAEQGSQNPKEALNYSLAPGAYNVGLKTGGQSVKVDLAPGTAWVVIALPTGGSMPMQLY